MSIETLFTPSPPPLPTSSASSISCVTVRTIMLRLDRPVLFLNVDFASERLSPFFVSASHSSLLVILALRVTQKAQSGMKHRPRLSCAALAEFYLPKIYLALQFVSQWHELINLTPLSDSAFVQVVARAL